MILFFFILSSIIAIISSISYLNGHTGWLVIGSIFFNTMSAILTAHLMFLEYKEGVKRDIY